MKKVLILVMCTFSLFIGCGSKPKQTDMAIEKSAFEISAGGHIRTGRIYVPTGYNPDKKYSLVFGLHGMGGSGVGFQGAGFDSVADRFDFIMIYPDGLQGSWDIVPGRNSYKQDLVFFNRMIDYFQDMYSIDENRIYVTGHSNGGFMAYRLAYELSGRITAAAPIAGLAYNHDLGYPGDKVSILHVHAVDDDIVPFAGYGDPSVFSAPQSVFQWFQYNGMSGQPNRLLLKTGATIDVFNDVENEITVALCYYPVGGHGIPVGSVETISDFFYNHPPRENRISFNDDLPAIINSDEIIKIRTSIEQPEKIEKLFLYSGKDLIEELGSEPFEFSFKPEMMNMYDLHMKALLKNGNTLASSDNLRFLVIEENLGSGAATESSEDENTQNISDYAVDGKLSTRWSSSYHDENYLILDLKETKTVSGVALYWETAYGSSYSIDVSTDGIEWNTVYKQNDGRGGLEFLTFQPEFVRFIRMKGEKRATEWGYSLWEFLVY